MQMQSFIIFLLLFSNASCFSSSANRDGNETELSGLVVSVLATDLTNPWELVWGAGAKLWITERDGQISRVDTGTGKVSPLYRIAEVVSRGEGGLLGMVLHPQFKSTPEVFVAYTYNKNGDYIEKIVRFTYNGNTLTAPLVLIDNIPAAGIHNGCRLLISTDLKLFISTGDASHGANAQLNSSLSGKVLRVNLDGSIPKDNPDPNSPIWSKGHRNSQGLVFAHGKLYNSEHGPSNDDEVNIIEKGRNYGWPEVEGFCDRSNERSFCAKYNVVQPVYAWSPTIAVCGLDYYNSNRVATFKNSLLLTTLKDQTLYSLTVNEAGDKVIKVRSFLQGSYGRLRDVCVTPDGKVFVCTSNGYNDKIIKISGTK
jgi:aldose sugar dehydrogenase